MDHPSRALTIKANFAVSLIATITLCTSLLLLTSPARSDELFVQQSNRNTANQSRWWTPDHASAMSPIPSLLAMVYPGHFLVSNSSRAGARHLENVDFDEAGAGRTGFGAWMSGQSHRSRAMLYSLDSSYELWESEIAETHSLMNVNGGSAYTLMQVSLTHAVIPVGMYIAPLRGSVGNLR